MPSKRRPEAPALPNDARRTVAVAAAAALLLVVTMEAGPTTERTAPDPMLPGISRMLQKQPSGMSISLLDPFTKTFTAPAPGPTGDGSTVTLELTLSSKPAPRAGAATEK